MANTKPASSPKTTAQKDIPAQTAEPKAEAVPVEKEGAVEVASDGRRRVVIEGVLPQIDAGRYPIKRTVGEKVVVEADLFTDGHDAVSGALLYRHDKAADWQEAPFEPLVNDRWRAQFTVSELGRYRYSVQGWVDHFKSWRRDFGKRVAAGQQTQSDLLVGAALIEVAAERATEQDAQQLKVWAALLKSQGQNAAKIALVSSEELPHLLERYPDKSLATTYGRELEVKVDSEKARFSAWYELFPRSCSPTAEQHGTFKDVEARLPYVAEMGFDILYFPPIHPIGDAHRKGRNNTLVTEPGDVGSPWAIGSSVGGHKAIHPQLGTLEDFRHLVARARDEYNIDIALDIAFQCSPDHPYVKEHPEWFRHRPDGTIQYAENPPKKYQDIYPFDFENANWQGLWDELTGVVLYWVAQGVRVFRVDNPHTKPFPFWEYLIAQVQQENPDVIFLAEAFTRPKVMNNLGKLGFTQSYTYFTWREDKWQLKDYFSELTQPPISEIFRPNPWPNTPDILPEHLQIGGRNASLGRLVLAATLSATYGIYGPAFELCEVRPREMGGEEYLDSEKYELKQWDLDDPNSLKGLIARVNRIRRDNAALQSDHNLLFHTTSNEDLICYSKHTDDLAATIVVVVNLDFRHTQSGWVELPLGTFGIDHAKHYQVHDLLNDSRYLWHGARNYVELPAEMPAHIFRIRRLTHTEHDFDYYL